MQIYNVYQSGKRLYIDEKEIPDNKIVVNKYENEVTTLRLVSDGTLPPRLYWALRNPKLSNKYFILKLLNNEDLIVGTDISAYPGLWDMLLIGTDEDYIIEGTDIDQSRLTYVSDHFGRLFVRDNFLEELDFEEQCSPTFKVFYDEIMFQLDNIPDLSDIPDKLSDLENDVGFISGVALKDDGEGNVKIVGTTFEGSETEEGGGGNYNLPVANETTLGGVKPLNKTEDMTLDVGVDKNGRLFAKGKDITVDSELDKESQNPVQNKVITAEVKALREENEALEQKNAELEEKNAELESSIEKLQIKTITSPSPFHHITDSANMKVLDFGMEGITEQETTSGKNLLDTSSLTEVTKYGVTFTPVYSNGLLDYILVDGTADGGNPHYYMDIPNIEELNTNNSLILTGCPTGGSATSYRIIVPSGTGAGDIGAGYTIEQGKHLDARIAIRIGNGVTVSNLKFYPMVRLATETDATYEPFTNGASPNPTHPQDITLAGVLNEETGRYEHKCCVGNKNILDKTTLQNGYIKTDGTVEVVNWIYYTDYVPVKTNTVLNLWNTCASSSMVRIVAVYDKNKNFLRGYRQDEDSVSSLQYNLGDNACYVRFNISTSLLDKYPMATLSQMPTDYTPHASQPFTLTSDRQLTKWDKLIKRDGVWGHSFWSIIKTFDGSDDEQWFKYTNNTKGFPVFRVESGVNFKTTGIAMCSHFIVKINAWNQGTHGNFGNNNGGSIYFVTEEVDNVSDWKTWLQSNNITVVLNTSEEQAFIPLPDEEQELLNNLETYYGVTNVYNNQGCPIWLEYVQSPQICMENVNKKIEEINNALLSLGANV